MSSVYVMDTSAFLDWWQRSYPPQVFPKIAESIDRLVQSGRMKVPHLVQEEVNAVGGDDLQAWLKDRKNILVRPDEALLDRVRRLTQAHPTLTDPEAQHEDADPYVIALAAITPGAIVVTAETYKRLKRKPGKRVFMPDVCDAEHVPHCTFLKLLQREGWQF